MKKEITRFGLFALVASLAAMTGCGYNNNTKDSQKQQTQPTERSDDSQYNGGYHQNGCS